MTQGQLLTLAIDSGIPRCRWHRVRWQGSVPAGTTVSISVSTSDSPAPAAQGVADGIWAAFAPGRPHPVDWQRVDNQRDFLIRQPEGRYLFMRIRMTGDGRQTPRIRRMRLDFPRQTSLDQLPLVFRDTPEAEDFSERFLALFDSFLDDVDDQIARMPALLDVDGVPDGVLPWLGSFLDIAMDPAWDAARRRRLLQAAPRLYRMRGTVDGMRAAIRLVFDVDPVIREAANERAWGALGGVALGGGVRLFGPSQWRFRLDRSRLGRAPLRSVGQIELDPFSSVADQAPVDVDRAAAHAGDDAGLGQRPAFEPRQDQIALRRLDVLQHAEDVDLEVLHLGALEDRAARADHPRLDFLDRHQAGRRRAAEPSRTPRARR